MNSVTVTLPAHLRTLAQVTGDAAVEVPEAATIGDVLDALEAAHPVLRGTMRDHTTRKRRPMVRFFACSEDISHQPMDTPLPEEVALGKEPFMVVGAIAGG